MVDKPWAHGVSHIQQPWYQPVVDWKYWPILGAFKKCNINQFTNKNTSSADFDDIHKVFLDIISKNTESLVQTGNYVTISIPYTTTMGYYVVSFFSTVILYKENTKYGQVFTAEKLVIKYSYLSSIKFKTIWYSET